MFMHVMGSAHMAGLSSRLSCRVLPCCVLQGTGVTSGLRKVTDDMKTKNRADRSGQVTATPAAAAPKAAPAKPAAAASRGPRRYGRAHTAQRVPPAAAVSVCQRVPGAGQPSSPLQLSGRHVRLRWQACLLSGELFVVLLLWLCVAPCRLELEQERKWVVENQVDQQELVVTVTDPKHSVYIYNCSGSVVQVGAVGPAQLACTQGACLPSMLGRPGRPSAPSQAAPGFSSRAWTAGQLADATPRLTCVWAPLLVVAPTQVKGKCNAISIDKCHKTGVVFEDVIASCELVNCNSVQVRLFVGGCCCCCSVG